MAGRRGRVSALPLLALGVACAPSLAIDRDPVGPDEVLFGAVLAFERDGAEPYLARVLSSRRLREGERFVAAAAPFTQVLSTWRLQRSGFVHPDGSPLTDADFDAMTMRAASQPADQPDRGACGRCLAPAFVAGPLVVHPGSSCAPPLSAVELQLGSSEPAEGGEPDLRRAALDQIRFEWQGPCACPHIEIPRATAELALDELTGIQETHTPAAISRSSGGVVGLFGSRYSTVISRTATVTTRTLSPAYIVGAVAVSDDEHLVATVRGGGIQYFTEWYQPTIGADWDWGSPIGGLTMPSFRMAVARAVPERPGHFLVGGERLELSPLASVVLCRASPALCRPLIEVVEGRRFERIEPLPDGSWVAIGDGGLVVHIDAIPDVSALVGQRINAGPERRWADSLGASWDATVGPVRWRAHRLERVALPAGDRARLDELRTAAVVGARVFLYMGASREPLETARDLMVSRTFARAELDRTQLPPVQGGFEIETCRLVSVARPRAIVATGTRTAELLMSNDRRLEVLRLDDTGALDPPEVRNADCALPAAQAPAAGFAYPFAEYVPAERDVYFGVAPGGAVAEVTGGGRLRWLHGGPTPVGVWTAVVPEAEGGGAWLFGPPMQVGYLAPGSADVVTRSAPALTQGVRDAALDTRVADPARGFVIIDRQGFIGRLVLDDGGERLDVITSTNVPAPTAVAEVAPGIHVAIATSIDDPRVREVLRIEGRDVLRATIPGDDPATDAQEMSFANPEPCHIARRASEFPYIGRSSSSLRGLSVSHGIAWVVGCGAEMMRVTAQTPQIRVERYAYERDEGFSYAVLPAGNTSPYHFTAVTALCPDHVLMAGPNVASSGSRSKYRVVELAPSSVVGPRTRLDADARFAGMKEEAPIAYLDKGHVLAMFPGKTTAPWIVTSGSQDNIPGVAHQLPSSEFLLFSNAPQAAVRIPDGRFVITLDGGGVLVSRGVD